MVLEFVVPTYWVPYANKQKIQAIPFIHKLKWIIDFKTKCKIKKRVEESMA